MDFDRAFQELVEKTLELKPKFMILAGDIFHTAHPSNVTLEKAVKNLSRLREAGIPVLAVDGSHDAAPNTVTGTILNPLDTAGLIHYLPRHEGACWRCSSCYVYGVPNYRTRRKTEEQLPKFYELNKPAPDKRFFNIFVFHMALDMPALKIPGMEAEASETLIPEGFNYYAAGHIHKRHVSPFRDGLLVYPGSTETVSYDEADEEKGFYHVEVAGDGEVSPNFIKLESPRRFIVLERDFTGFPPAKITELTVELVRSADQEEAVIVPILKGILPAEASRSEVDVSRIREAALKALLVHPVIMLRERAVPEDVVQSIFLSELKDLKTKSFEYFMHIFSERFSREEAERIAKAAVNLIEPLARKKEEEVKRILEELIP